MPTRFRTAPFRARQVPVRHPVAIRGKYGEVLGRMQVFWYLIELRDGEHRCTSLDYVLAFLAPQDFLVTMVVDQREVRVI